MADNSNPVAARTVAMFFDGTWNDTNDNTNVWRMKSLCADRDVFGRTQIAYYDRGVNGFWGGCFGIGLTDNVRQGYEWLVENYQPNDEIYIFGFSRGAFTARSLAGFIAKQGLLKRGAPLGAGQVYDRYRRPNCETIYTLEDRMKAGKPEDFDLEDKWMLAFSQLVPIKMVGVWDTVGALGLPVFKIPGFSSSTLGFLHTGLRQSIQNAYHAIAIDEHREKFDVTLWTKFSSTQAHDRSLQSVEQRWFVGAHANVGGGYFSDPLPQPSLRWMMAKARALGMNFVDSIASDNLDQARPADSYGAFLHGAYKWFSRSFNRVIGANPSPTSNVNKPGETEQPINETIDATVFDYCRKNPDYRPESLMNWAQAKSVDVASVSGSVLATDPKVAVLD